MTLKDHIKSMIEGGNSLDQAIAWHLRLAEADEAGWLAFTEWLEASPDHVLAYDGVAITDGILDGSKVLACAQLLPAAGSANDNYAAAYRGGGWLGVGAGLVAAAAAAVAFLPGMLRQPAPTLYETPAGVARLVEMADGSRVELGGGSRLRVDASAPRLALLERGEAVFHVRHDSARPFTVKVSDVAVQDLGTVFSVARDSDAVRVAVAEGAVAVSREGRRLSLGPGETAKAGAQGNLQAGRIAPAAVGSWRNRSLTFQGEPLSNVVERLNRLYALHISLGSNLSERPFTGMVQLTGDAARDVPHLAALIGTDWRRDGEGWLLSSAGPTTR
jgi:transmembrane sensor